MVKKVYPFTNENISSYQNLYNFDNARVLSVLGSGDQYFSSLLYGAKEIDVYDCNFLTWDFFVLKYVGIIILNYEEFYEYFVVKKLNDLNYFKKLLPYLPLNVSNRLNKIIKKYKSLSRMLYLDVISNKYNNGSSIPYFDKEEFYKLKSILLNQKIPTFYLSDLQLLPTILNKQSYDIILTSNIFDWLYEDLKDECPTICVREYKKILSQFNSSEIQALYCWDISETLEKELENNDFEIVKVPTTKTLSLVPDSVVSLRKR